MHPIDFIVFVEYSEVKWLLSFLWFDFYSVIKIADLLYNTRNKLFYFFLGKKIYDTIE